MWRVGLGVEEGGTKFQGGQVGVGLPTQWPRCLAWSSEVLRFWDSTSRDWLLRSWRCFCAYCLVFHWLPCGPLSTGLCGVSICAVGGSPCPGDCLSEPGGGDDCSIHVSPLPWEETSSEGQRACTGYMLGCVWESDRPGFVSWFLCAEWFWGSLFPTKPPFPHLCIRISITAPSRGTFSTVPVCIRCSLMAAIISTLLGGRRGRDWLLSGFLCRIWLLAVLVTLWLSCLDLWAS